LDDVDVCDRIGTNEGTSSYTNPADRTVGVRMSSTAGSGITAAFDRNYTSSPMENSYGGDSTPWIEFDFRQYKVLNGSSSLLSSF
jgi:hypothetical protein